MGNGSFIPMTYQDKGQAQRTRYGSNNYQYDAGSLASYTANGTTIYLTETPDGQLISERFFGGGAYYYLYDGIGSVVGLTDSAGNLVNSYAYDPYGNATSVSGTVTNPFRFAGAIWDPDTGLYKMGERYYDPQIGQFTQEDPAGEGYTYAGDDPINAVDPTGRMEDPGGPGGPVMGPVPGPADSESSPSPDDPAKGRDDPAKGRGTQNEEPGPDEPRVCRGLKSAPGYPEDFGGVKLRKVNINDPEVRQLLRSAPGSRWMKIFYDGWLDGRMVSLHYFMNSAGQVFVGLGVKVVNGWSNL